MSKFMEGYGIQAIDSDIIADMELLLDFVERWNKQDKESNVSQAAQKVSKYLATYKLEENHE